jgi:hypothetical protein
LHGWDGSEKRREENLAAEYADDADKKREGERRWRQSVEKSSAPLGQVVFGGGFYGFAGLTRSYRPWPRWGRRREEKRIWPRSTRTTRMKTDMEWRVAVARGSTQCADGPTV